MRITANQTFLNDRDRYEEGRSYDVSDADGVYFVRCGWADAEGVESGSTDVAATLDVHDAAMGQEG